MKTKINTQKCIFMVVALLLFHANSYAQKSIVNEQWEQRTQEILPELKKGWDERLNSINSTSSTNRSAATHDVGLPQTNLLDAEYTPVACFILDYDSYLRLTFESNLVFLMKLDTTRVDYLVFDKNINQYTMSAFGMLQNGQWRPAGYGTWDQSSLDFFAKLKAKNISLCKLRVFTFPDYAREWGFFIENGQLMCLRQDMSEPKPLLETLIEYRNKSLANPRRR